MRTAPGLIAWSLIVIAQCGPVAAEDVTGLLKPLDLKGYASRTTPPRFSGRTVEAREISLADLRGQVLLLNFWASWCLECHLEMPALEGLHRDFASRGLAVVGVNKINGLYGVVGLPTTFIVARDGRAVALVVGPREWASPPARALIEALLAEPAQFPGLR